MNKMKSILFVVLVCCVAIPLAAQDRNMHIAIVASQADIDGEDIGDGFESDFETGTGFGIAASHAYNRFLSAEVAIFSVRSEAGLLFESEAPFDLGHLNLVPVMIGGQLHFLGGRVDPYVGAGAAYVMANDLHSPDLDAAGIGRIEIDNELTYYLNAGIAVEFTRGFGLVVDGRFVQYEPSTQSAATGVEQDLDLSPTILSAGLRFRF